MPPPDEPRPERDRTGDTVLEHYRLDALIGRGGVGVVYRAVDTRRGQTVAVKIMREDILRVRTAAARFLREARIAQTLAHPAVPRGLEAGVDRLTGAPVLVMEYVAGKNFGAILQESGPLAIRDALALGARVATALDAAHRAGVVHRDIKPENLMLLEGGTVPEGVVVLDFGLAFCLDEPRLSVTHSFVGSLEYMSPEQARGEVVSSASDIYALGATLVHLLTGKTLYEGGYLQQIAGHARSPVPSLRARRAEIPRIVEHYLTSMLEKDPARRPVSAREVADALTEMIPVGEGPATSMPPPPSSVASAPTSAAAPNEATAADRQDLIEKLHACSSQLHHVTRATAAAHAKMVQEIVEIAARRMERTLLENERDAHARGGDAEKAAEVAARLAALGDPDADAKREAALEGAVARLQSRAREEEDEILTTIQQLQAELVGIKPV